MHAHLLVDIIVHYQIRCSKKDMINNKITDCSGDTRRLFALMTQLTGTQQENPLPSGLHHVIAENFADFFQQKIMTIQSHLQDKPMYNPPAPNITTKMSTFHTLSPAQVHSILRTLPLKSCELDLLPTDLLRTMEPLLLPYITTIVNSSLEQGIFPDS